MIADYTEIEKKLFSFKREKEHFKILKRNTPKQSEIFFKKLLNSFISISGFVNHATAKEDLKKNAE
tara:strand:+ start:244 stop:441 length:198 start_codon:yes stop_codon:yes gene_type:complete